MIKVVVQVIMQVITIDDILKMSMDELSAVDIDFIVGVRNCYLRQVTKVKLIFTGEEAYHEELFEIVIKQTISFDLKS
jgi:hypothetical protein